MSPLPPDDAREKLTADESWKEKTPLDIEDLLDLTRLCLNCTYFKYDGQFYKQIHGAAMGSPLSPIICNLYMEKLEQDALSTIEVKPKFYKRYVDDIFQIVKKSMVDITLKHFDDQDDYINFTVEKEVDRSLAFLDTLVKADSEGNISLTVYRKDTHTDQYLNYNSEHPLEHKMSVVYTLLHRAETIVTREDDKNIEKDKIRKALHRCGYPDWTIKRGESLLKRQKNNPKQNEKEKGKKKGFVVVPYIKGLGEKIKRVLNQYGVSTAFKPCRTIKQELVAPKDKIPKEQKTGVVYHIKCECGEDYIGETERQLKERVAEHTRKSSVKKSAMAKHLHTANHKLIPELKILDQEPDWHRRGVKEAIQIKRHKPSLNKDGDDTNCPVPGVILFSEQSGGHSKFLQTSLVTSHSKQTLENGARLELKAWVSLKISPSRQIK